MASKIEGAQVFTGAISFQSSVTLPTETVGNSNIKTDAGIDADKLKHQYAPTLQQNGTNSAETRVLHLARGAGTIEEFRVGVVGVITGDATVTVDLKKNGTSVLTGTVGLSSAQAAYAEVAGTISTPAIADGDVLTVVVTVNAGTGALGTGLYMQAITREVAG